MKNNHPLHFSNNKIKTKFLTYPIYKKNLINKNTSQTHLLPYLHTIYKSYLLINIKKKNQHHTQKINYIIYKKNHNLKSNNIKNTFPINNTKPNL